MKLFDLEVSAPVYPLTIIARVALNEVLMVDPEFLTAENGDELSKNVNSAWLPEEMM